MSGINGTITMTTAEYRPCYVNGQKALFHRWVEKRTVVAPSPLKGGHAGGEFAGTYALVEMDDGSIKIAYPNEVRFADNKLNKYAFDYFADTQESEDADNE